MSTRAVSSANGSVKIISLPRGAPGKKGDPGTNVLNGAGIPDPDQGSLDEFYIDTNSQTIYGPKTDAGWGSGTSLVGPLPTDEALEALIDPKIQPIQDDVDEVAARPLALSLTFDRFNAGATKGQVIGAIEGVQVGRLVTWGGDGRVEVRGDPTTGVWNLCVGWKASDSGDQVVGAVSEIDPAGGPSRVLEVRVTAMKPLPALPLASGAKVATFGHSFIQRGFTSAYRAGNAATSGLSGSSRGGAA